MFEDVLIESSSHSGGSKTAITLPVSVAIHAADGAFLATAAWSPTSKIRARVWSFDARDQIGDEHAAGRENIGRPSGDSPARSHHRWPQKHGMQVHNVKRPSAAIERRGHRRRTI